MAWVTPAIGDNTFLSLKGPISPLAETVLEITRPNVDGAAYKKQGKRSAPTTLDSVRDFDSEDDAKDALLAYKALTGSLVTVTDDTGIVWTSVLVLNVEQVVRQKVGPSAGGLAGTGGWLLQCRWTVQATQII